ncbi:dynein intermediate chain, cytosolic [Cryptococcus wingfieldii CBS 7118]|uniref:Dynein intermediate chain, cytosolic n=1 Tax=Cryptococcus wingfieldii CBS 7118 TaxID=1295528 RepID=A0A1E3J1U0_9TREE|nr:dynein intermediate chain, cytosolic [Cryptococcus wingfieldii CBS 7118]ODN94850.1 dynein intermediate chain, cytosolic [Cryptococcus wingfieldii CBS 7118]
MSDRRRQEIEEKRAKLAELRRARDERKQLLANTDQASEPMATNRRDVNDLVDSLLTRPASPFTPAPSSRPSAFGTPGRPSGSTPPSSIPGTPGGRASRLSNEGSSGRATGPTAGMGMTGLPSGADRYHLSVLTGGCTDSGLRDSMMSPFSRPATDFVDHQEELFELPTKPAPVTYSKGIQTMVSSFAADVNFDDDYISDTEEERQRKRNLRDGETGRETEDEMRKRILEELEEERKALENELKEQGAELSDEQRQAVFAAPDFSSFIEQSTRITQRALSDGYDYIKDYTIGGDGAFDESEGVKVKLFCAFSDERWTNGRSVTDVDWSPKAKLSAASYNRNPSAVNDPDGIVAVWNLHLLERPEFIFHSPSDVLSVTFSPYHPTLIFGGSYSGQVLLWDTRAKHLPVLKTPLSATGHTYPIYDMKMVGTQNANNLISSSTDGLVCSWLADMLAQPQETLPLTMPSHNKTDEVSITTFDFPDNETSTFWIGTEEGSVYQANRYDRASAKAGSNTEDIYKGHAAPVTGLHFHPGTGSIDFSDLFLTSSIDWTVKLWRTKAAATAATAKGTTGSGVQGGKGEDRVVPPMHSFEEAGDYVFDVKWHPHHPAVFGSVDGTGKFDLWNINQDVEVPITSTQVSPRAINKLAWDRTPTSRKAALGSSDGKVYVYDVAEKLVLPRDGEWVEMQKTVQGMAAAREVGGAGVFGGEAGMGAGKYDRRA